MKGLKTMMLILLGLEAVWFLDEVGKYSFRDDHTQLLLAGLSLVIGLAYISFSNDSAKIVLSATLTAAMIYFLRSVVKQSVFHWETLWAAITGLAISVIFPLLPGIRRNKP